ncbi:MAG: thiamine-phosphate kinase [Planctomycetaceae bacterium]|nr:thiamine-phosphate kinase [Planctomycetaceae bacterium]
MNGHLRDLSGLCEKRNNTDHNMELEFIEQLRQGVPTNELVRLGIGDDAAILDTRRLETVLTVDLLTEGVDFLLDEVAPQWIGRKALAVNLSDLAAMAAQPVAALVAVALPKECAKTLAPQLLEGMTPLLQKYNVALIGGDTNTWDGGLVISVMAIGRVTEHGPFKRSGAKPGDRILVTGTLGGSILRRQFLFEPRINEALYLNGHHRINAAIDVSDGLSLDLARLAAESKVGAIIDAHHVPISDDAKQLVEQQSETQGTKSPLEHALYDGEDFELLLAVPPEEAERLLATQPLMPTMGVPLTDIGVFVAEPGQWLRDHNGVSRQISPQGFVH